MLFNVPEKISGARVQTTNESDPMTRRELALQTLDFIADELDDKNIQAIMMLEFTATMIRSGAIDSEIDQEEQERVWDSIPVPRLQED